MKYILTIFFSLVIIFIFINCSNHSSSPSSCMENPDSNSRLIVIVGEKISIKEIEPYIDTVMMMGDSRFTAHYRILQKICGDYDKDTITFTVFDHYGFPEFGNYDFALLFLSNYKGNSYHEKYQFFPLYKSKDGRWASNYQYLEYFDETTVKPEKIEFEKELSFSIAGMTRKRTQTIYPEPYYSIDKVNKKAVAVMGNYVPELFQMKKEGTLHARGFYGKPDSIIPRPVEIEEIEWQKLSRKDSIQLLSVWQSLIKAIKVNNNSVIKQISLDSIVCSVCEGMPRAEYENNLESIGMFIDSAQVNFEQADLWSVIKRSKYKIDVTKYTKRKPTTFTLKENEKLIIYSISFVNKLITDESTYWVNHSFEFVKIDDQFRFYSMNSSWSSMRYNKK